MRTSDFVLASLVLGGLLAASLHLARRPAPVASAVPVTGPARVVDGDTLRIAGRTIRLAGMDAPELAQTCRLAGRDVPCGRLARERIVALVAGASVACSSRGRDRYGRDLARCAVGAADLGGTLVAEGLAVAYGDYVGEERAARAAARGLWAGTFERPDAWRRAHPRGMRPGENPEPPE